MCITREQNTKHATCRRPQMLSNKKMLSGREVCLSKSLLICVTSVSYDVFLGDQQSVPSETHVNEKKCISVHRMYFLVFPHNENAQSLPQSEIPFCVSSVLKYPSWGNRPTARATLSGAPSPQAAWLSLAFQESLFLRSNFHAMSPEFRKMFDNFIIIS